MSKVIVFSVDHLEVSDEDERNFIRMMAANFDKACQEYDHEMTINVSHDGFGRISGAEIYYEE